MDKKILAYFASLIEKHIGIIYSEENYFQLQKRLEDICKKLDYPNVEHLWKQVQVKFDGEVKDLILDSATNNQTSFFRDPKLFEVIERKLIPILVEQSTYETKIWSAASSFGQEPYSLSMLLTEAQQKFPGFKWQMTATDVCNVALSRAKAGIYSQLELGSGLSEERVKKYFSKTDSQHWQISFQLRSKIHFSKLNLLESLDSLGKFDLVLCRNVLIYQKVEKKREILSKIEERLKPNGYLIMGAGESLLGLSTSFSQVNHDGVVFYQKQAQDTVTVSKAS